MDNIEKIRIVKATIENKKDRYIEIGRKLFNFKNIHWWKKHLEKYVPCLFQEDPLMKHPSIVWQENQVATIGLLDGKTNAPCSYAEEFPFCVLRVNRKILDSVFAQTPKQIRQLVNEDSYNNILYYVSELPQYVDALLICAIDMNDFTASCIAYYLLLENGISHSFQVFIRRMRHATKNENVFEDFIETINGKEETTPVKVTPDFLKTMAFRTDKKDSILSLLSIRRYHLEHKEDYRKFTQQFSSSIIDKYLSPSKSCSYNLLSLSATEIRKKAPIMASFVQFMAIVYGISSAPEETFSDDFNLLAYVFPILQSDAVIKYLRHSLDKKEPCLMHALYWLIFDNGCLDMGKKIVKEMMEGSKSTEEMEKARVCLKALIECSYGNFHDRDQWMKIASNSPNPQVYEMVKKYLKEVGRRRIQNAQYMLLEELMKQGVNTEALIRDIRPYLIKKGGVSKSKVLACLFLALEEQGCIIKCPHYRVFHMALVEFYDSIFIKNSAKKSIEGWDEAEGIVNARKKEQKEEEQGKKKEKDKEEIDISIRIPTSLLQEMGKKFHYSKKEPLPPQLPIKDSLKDRFR